VSVPHDFDHLYATSVPPWDIGRAQRAFERLAASGGLAGPVLDVGCGTGEHALLAAASGHDALGVDIAPHAIARAREKAAERGLAARFEVADALRLPDLGEQFATVLDCGLFHVFDDLDRGRFVEALGGVVGPGGCYHMLCFRDAQPGDWGPRRVSREEIRASFDDGWEVSSLEPATIELTLDRPEALAWHAVVVRT
jgi:SAM-dependent methyltransferase